jgi:hypothetical protein
MLAILKVKVIYIFKFLWEDKINKTYTENTGV